MFIILGVLSAHSNEFNQFTIHTNSVDIAMLVVAGTDVIFVIFACTLCNLTWMIVIFIRYSRPIMDRGKPSSDKTGDVVIVTYRLPLEI